MLKEKLIELREYTGLTQLGFADELGCSMQHISQMELGKSPVSFKTLSRFAKKFGFEIDLKLRIKKK